MSFKHIVLIALIATTPITARADADSEREALAMISNELNHLIAMVTESSSQADTASRIKFRYDWLAKDLEMVKSGVDDHLDTPRQPRPVEPLKGDYRR